MLQLRILEQQLARRNRVGTVWSAKVKRTIVWKGVSSSGKVGCRRGFSFLLVDMYSLLSFFSFWNMPRCGHATRICENDLQATLSIPFLPFFFFLEYAKVLALGTDL